MQSRRPQEVQRPIPREVLEFEPATPLVLDRKMFLRSLKSAPRGASPGHGGCTYEHLRILLDDLDTFELLFEAATSFARASLPPDIAPALMSARLTALTKVDGGGSERSQQDVPSGGWWPEHWQSNLHPCSTTSVHRFNTRCPHVPGLIVWGTCFELPRTRITVPPYSAWTALVHTIMC